MKTSELTGAALDWAVTKCEGFDHSIDAGFKEWGMNGWATDWAQGGPIIEREGIQIQKHRSGWVALPEDAQFSEEEYQEGPTILIAAMRCYVASKLGDEVEVPEELEVLA
jgi:hypothetical protein